MGKTPVPDVTAPSIYALRPRLFTNRGIRFLLLDVDNTLAPYTQHEATPRMIGWVRDMEAAGLRLFVLSNNRGTRPETFAAALGLPFRKRAKKPFPKAARQVMAEQGVSPAETAFIGDQIYTDMLCARACGCFAVLVEPIELSNVWLRLRYGLELPFRLKAKWKTMK